MLAEIGARADAAIAEIMERYERETGLKPELFTGSSPGAWHVGTAHGWRNGLIQSVHRTDAGDAEKRRRLAYLLTTGVLESSAMTQAAFSDHC